MRCWSPNPSAGCERQGRGTGTVCLTGCAWGADGRGGLWWIVGRGFFRGGDQWVQSGADVTTFLFTEVIF